MLFSNKNCLSGYICHGGWQESLNEVKEQYVVISGEGQTSQRICVRLTMMDTDNANVSMMANSKNCLMSTHQDQDNGQLWSFNLTRTSKLAIYICEIFSIFNPFQVNAHKLWQLPIGAISWKGIGYCYYFPHHCLF